MKYRFPEQGLRNESSIQAAITGSLQGKDRARPEKRNQKPSGTSYGSWEFQMSVNPPLSILLPEKPVPKTGNKPGVTKGKQWIRLNKNVELLDTPGILWPKFEDQAVGMRLAYIGSIKDDILNIEELALGLIGYLQEFYPAALTERYSLEEDQKPLDILTSVAKARGCLKKGEELDYGKASRLLLEEFRSGKLGQSYP